MIDLMKGEGCAAGKTVPLRLLIGRDAREAVKTTCEEMLKTMEEWKDVIDSTDFRRTRASFGKRLYMLSFSTPS